MRSKTKIGYIEDETAILPHVIADVVVRELIDWARNDQHIDKPLGGADAAVDYLADRAQQCYEHDDRFRKTIRSAGNRGRDQLYIWSRHWLAGYAKDHWYDLYRLLPESYKVGRELPRR